MSKVLKARVVSGRYKGETVRVTNVSVSETGKKNAACLLTSGGRANIPVEELEVLPEEAPPEPAIKSPKTSMPFVSGSTGSRTMTHTKNMSKKRIQPKHDLPSEKYTPAVCEVCGEEYNLEDRRGRPGKLTRCENCSFGV